jgi:uncharacterized protein
MSSTTSSKAFLGSGLSLQITLSPQGQLAMDMGVDGNGQLSMSSLDDHVQQSILLILETATGERMMRPDFGAGLQALVFSPMNAATSALVQHEITDALTRLEPRINVLGVDVSTDPSQPGRLEINLQYSIRSTDTMFNLVYPFFLERGPY